MLENSRMRAQSAMEYLMTYGWAILIIAVVLGVLFSLGVFSGNSLLGTSCVAAAGYYCANPIMLTGSGIGASTLATLMVSLGQNTGSSQSGIFLECGNQTDVPVATGIGWATPSNILYTAAPIASAGSWVGNVLPAGVAPTAGTLSSGQVVSSVQMVCQSSYALGSTPAVGTSFTGYIWEIYSSGGANVITKIATVSVKVS